MSREVVLDFEELKKFLLSYNLSIIEGEDSLMTYLSQLHKKYYAFLTFIGELQFQKENLENKVQPIISDTQLDYLIESCSDVGNAIFISIHGGYKAAKLMLRSSIETFCKGFFQDEEPRILTEKSLYVVFDMIKDLPSMKQEPFITTFDIIHNEYKLLCADTHTASGINMAKITALKYFPTYDDKMMSKICSIVLKIIPVFLLLLGLKFNKYYLNMDFRNKEHIISHIPKGHRSLINGIV